MSGARFGNKPAQNVRMLKARAFRGMTRPALASVFAAPTVMIGGYWPGP